MRFLAILLYLFPVPAFAHWGHLPELAGHSHWIGMAAAAAAAAAAIVLAFALAQPTPLLSVLLWGRFAAPSRLGGLPSQLPFTLCFRFVIVPFNGVSAQISQLLFGDPLQAALG